MCKTNNQKNFAKAPENFTCNGKCSCCGNCCIPWCPITEEEYQIINDYIEKNKIEPIPLKERNNYYMDCCFHDRKNKKCLIYEVRPEVCKNFICSSSYEKVDKDRRYYDKRADINGDSGILRPFDLLFYGNPTTLVIFLHYELKLNKKEEIIEHLINTGNYDVAQAITEGKVKLLGLK